MRITLINSTDLVGGAAITAYRIAEGLRALGHEVTFLVYKSQGARAPFVEPYIKNKLDKSLYLIRVKLEERIVKRIAPSELYNFSPAFYGVDISRHPAVRNADVIHLHWVNHAFLTVESIGKLMALGKPILWTQHDMWPFTGGCHHSRGCVKYETYCHQCPVLGSKIEKDLSFKVWYRKSAAYDLKNVGIAAPSTWMRDHARSSSLFKEARFIEAIPNPIDSGLFAPGDKLAARRILGLPEDKRIVLFGAVNALTNKRKGVDYLIEALNILSAQNPDFAQNTMVAIFGADKEAAGVSFPLETRLLGHVREPEKMAQLYRAADVYAVPSLEESFSLTTMESLSCGIPAVGFEVGGIPDIIDHKETGYLARYLDAADLADGIAYCLSDAHANRLAEAGRAKVLARFDQRIVVGEYLNAYTRLMTQV